MDTTAYDGAALVNRFDEQRENARAIYSNAINDITDRILSEFLLPGDQIAIAQDIAQLTAFLMAVKIATLNGDQPTRRSLMAAWHPMEKQIKSECPVALMNFMDVVNEQQGAAA